MTKFIQKSLLLLITITLQTPASFAQVDITQEREILEDLLDSTTRVAYRMQTLGRYEELAKLLSTKPVDFGDERYQSKACEARLISLTGGVATAGGLLLASAGIEKNKGSLFGGAGLAVLGITSINFAENYNKEVLDLDEHDLSAEETQAIDMDIQNQAKSIAKEALSIVGLDDLPANKNLKLEVSIADTMRANRARVIPNASINHWTSAKELEESRSQVYIKPFSVAKIMQEQKLLNQKQKESLDELLAMRGQAIANPQVSGVQDLLDIRYEIILQIERSRNALKAIEKLTAISETVKHNVEITTELKALEEAIADSDALIAEWEDLP